MKRLTRAIRRRLALRRRLASLRDWTATPAAPRILCLVVVLTGLMGAVVAVSRPVKVAYPDDVLLRFGDLGAARIDVPAADCGSALDALNRNSDASSLVALARDNACRQEGARRLALALAAGGIAAGSGLLALGLSASRRPHDDRDSRVTLPNRPPRSGPPDDPPSARSSRQSERISVRRVTTAIRRS